MPFTAWEDCLKGCEDEGGSDEERQDRFVKQCMDQTLKLRDCVEAHPEYHGEMFGAPGEGDDNAAAAAAPAEEGATPPADGGK